MVRLETHTMQVAVGNQSKGGMDQEGHGEMGPHKKWQQKQILTLFLMSMKVWAAAPCTSTPLGILH